MKILGTGLEEIGSPCGRGRWDSQPMISSLYTINSVLWESTVLRRTGLYGTFNVMGVEGRLTSVTDLLYTLTFWPRERTVTLLRHEDKYKVSRNTRLWLRPGEVFGVKTTRKRRRERPKEMKRDSKRKEFSEHVLLGRVRDKDPWDSILYTTLRFRFV